ncbi:MAG: hypothetical protein KDB00_20310 [Planctomycetales bacterium]|nr:hypothetical protein [Planctomycetales bacterium]
MTAPRLVPTESKPRTLPKPKIENQPEPNKEGSIFDTLDNLDDPFQEDAARLRREYGSIRPTGNRSATGSAPQSIGSGLRPAKEIESLRPVSHEESIVLKPIGQRRILAPYRPSR